MNSAGQWLVILAEAVGVTLLIIFIVKAKNGAFKHRFWKWLFKETLPEPEDRDEWGNR
jgi:uncharacterized integral membrane protein